MYQIVSITSEIIGNRTIYYNRDKAYFLKCTTTTYPSESVPGSIMFRITIRK